MFGLPINATRAGRVLAERIDTEDAVTVIPRHKKASSAFPRSISASRTWRFDYIENTRRLPPSNHVAATCNSAPGAAAAGSCHAASFVTEMQAASAIRIEIDTLCTRYCTGPPNGARRSTCTAAPGTNPISISREATRLAPEIAVTMAEAPGLKSANRMVFTRPPPAQKREKRHPENRKSVLKPRSLKARHRHVANETQSQCAPKEYRS